MPTLIKLQDGKAAWADNTFTTVLDEEPAPDGDIIVSLARFLADGESLLSNSRQVGVRVETDDAVEDLVESLSRVAVVAVNFPKFRDGRAFTSARLLRERFKFAGEIRAVGDVFQEQAGFMVRCGFNAFEPSDGSTPEVWEKATHRFRHVYQRAADARAPAYEERKLFEDREA